MKYWTRLDRFLSEYEDAVWRAYNDEPNNIKALDTVARARHRCGLTALDAMDYEIAVERLTRAQRKGASHIMRRRKSVEREWAIVRGEANTV